jgi:predicted short-subunit dehydrogenase-like oxidoreductase (DUF2520 family)
VGWSERVSFVNPAPASTFALVGPGRAGMSLALALEARGWLPVSVCGRSPDAPSTRAALSRLGGSPVPPEEAGRGASLILVATPDFVIEDVARSITPGLEPQALVVHCSGARGLDALAPVRAARPDVEIGALHPLQTFAGPDPARLQGAWAAVAGPPAVTELALELGLRPFVVRDEQRVAYHAAAVVASNHLVALLGQVTRIAKSAAVPIEAFWPLVHATVANVEQRGAADALTGPVARGDLPTVAAHLRALAPGERDIYAAMARAALVLCGRDDPGLAELLGATRGEVLA